MIVLLASEANMSVMSRDTFNGNYAVEYVEQIQQGSFDIERAISRACKASARTIEQLGCQESIPWKDEIVASTQPAPGEGDSGTQEHVSNELAQTTKLTQFRVPTQREDVVATVNGTEHSTPSQADP